MRALADLDSGVSTVAMLANTPATPAMTSVSATNATASDRAVAATGMAARLNTRIPMEIQMIRAAVGVRDSFDYLRLRPGAPWQRLRAGGNSSIGHPTLVLSGL